MLTEYNVIKEGQHFKKFFPDNCPNKAIILAILEGKVYGKIWLNDQKKACLITTHSFNFIAGDIDDNFLESCLKFIPKTETSFLVNCSDSYFFPKNLAYKTRVYYSGTANDLLNLPQKIDAKIQDKFHLENINAGLFEDCHWHTRFLELYQSKQQFLTFGYGSVLRQASEIVAELYGIIGEQCLEIGAFAQDKYRGYGLVPFMIAHSLKPFCHRHRLFIYASCDRENIASEKTMIHIGLKKEYEYDVLHVSKLNIDNMPIASPTTMALSERVVRE